MWGEFLALNAYIYLNILITVLEFYLATQIQRGIEYRFLSKQTRIIIISLKILPHNTNFKPIYHDLFQNKSDAKIYIQVQYGGRVTDDFDKRLLCTIANDQVQYGWRVTDDIDKRLLCTIKNVQVQYGGRVTDVFDKRLVCTIKNVQVQYGGRVTDDFDKRLLCTITNVWFTDALIAPGFEFYEGNELTNENISNTSYYVTLILNCYYKSNLKEITIYECAHF